MAERKPPETATERLSRLLAMVPWLLRHQGVETAEAAREFGITEDQLVDDLQLLFVCGTPGGSHAELIDATWDTGHVYIDNADDIAAPMRLTRDEAVTLTAGLHALQSTGTSSEVVERTLAKLRDATAGELSGTVAAELDDGTQHAAFAPLRDALERHRRVHMTYFVPTRDESTERDVDPMRMIHLDGHWYLEGWCHRATAVRLFRVDRIEDVSVLDVDGTPPASATPRDLDAALFVPSAEDLTVVLETTPDSNWIADYYPVEASEPLDDGGRRVTIRVAEPALITRLVLQAGGSVRVRSPQSMVDLIAEETAGAEAAYESGE